MQVKIIINVMILKTIISVLFLIYLQFSAYAITASTHIIEKKIAYHAPFANEVTLVWGIDNWQQVKKELWPADTKIKDNLMYTPLSNVGGSYITTLSVPSGSKIDFLFHIPKGPFDTEIDHWDVNYGGAERDYHTIANDNVVAYIYPDLSIIKAPAGFTILFFGKQLFFILLALSVIVLLLKKFILKTSFRFTINPFVMLMAVTIALYMLNIFIRASISGSFWMLFLSPSSAINRIFIDAYYDSLVLIFIVSFFGSVLYIFRNFKWVKRSFFLFFLFIAIVFLISGLVNIKVVEYLGAPFNYRWFHYSGFLQTTDAKNAIFAHFDYEYLFNSLYIILTGVILSLLIYLSLAWFIFKIKKEFLLISFLGATSIYIFAGYYIVPQQSKYNKTANPLYFFINSLSFFSKNGLFALEDGASEDFNLKKTPLPAELKIKFKEAAIRNVLIFVLESTPAEYVSTYNKQWKITSTLDSLAAYAAVFENAYASAPSTNKSLVSLLCGIYPWLSYQNLTYAHPDINLPSLASELKNEGFRTAFFNSGDTEFNNAKGFLQHHGFDLISDSKSNNCGKHLAYTNNCEGCDGSSDECLEKNLFSWLDQNKEKPFFSVLWTYQTHYPYFVTGKDEFFTADIEMNRYLNALKEGDRVLGTIIKGLKDRNISDNTLIVILGDHGEAFGRHDQLSHASKIYEENIHIPLLFVNKNLFDGKKYHTMAGISDIAPTVLSILEKQIPEQWQGSVLFSNENDKNIYFYSPWSDNWFGIRNKNYKLLYNATLNEYELYDLDLDPFEEKNLENQYPEIRDKLKRELSAWVKYQKGFMDKIINSQ